MKSPFLLVGLLAVACNSAGDPPTGTAPVSVAAVPHVAAPHVARAEALIVHWRPVPDPVPLNEPFEIAIELFDPVDELPLPGATLLIDAWMPAHFHGMLRRPEVIDLGGGHYRAKGMLFHMRGHWQLRFDLLDDNGRRTRATSDVELP
jgi:hypothetical protein